MSLSMHEAWKQAKKSAKHVNVDMLFKKDLGGALDKMDKEWNNLETLIKAHKAAGTLTNTEIINGEKLMKPVVSKVQGIISEYEKLVIKHGVDNKAKYQKSTDAKVRANCKSISDDCVILCTELSHIREKCGVIFITLMQYKK